MNKPQRPTSVRYEVWVNGKSTGQYLVSANDRFKSSLRDTEKGEYDKVEFSLSDLLISDDRTLRIGDSIIKFLPREGKIECTIAQHERHYKVSLVRNTEKSHDLSEETWKSICSAIALSKIKFILNGAPIKQNDSLPASKALVKSISVEGQAVEGITLSVSGVTYTPEKRMIISYAANRSVPLFTPDEGLMGTPIFKQDAPVTSSQVEDNPPSSQRKHMRRIALIGFLIATLISIFGGTYYYVLNLKEENIILQDEVSSLNSQKATLLNSIQKMKSTDVPTSAEELQLPPAYSDKDDTQNPKDSKKEDVKKTSNSDPLTEIQSRSDFAEFMQLVNAREWELIQQHEIYKALKNKGLQKYTFKIQHFCNPNGMFGANGLGKEANKVKNKKIIEWKQNTKAKDLIDVSRKVDALMHELKCLN